MSCPTAHNALPLATAQDHKRAYDGDEGPNTGGMGAYSPAPVMTDGPGGGRHANHHRADDCNTAARRGTPFKGVLYAGLMITSDGPQLIEYNTRFGDPECQVLMMRLESDLLELLLASASTAICRTRPATWTDDAALTVVLAAKGYPGGYEKGHRNQRGDSAPWQRCPSSPCFHAGTKRDGRTGSSPMVAAF